MDFFPVQTHAFTAWDTMQYTHIGHDFEGRSAVSLTDVGAHKYSYHPTSSPICLGWMLYNANTRARSAPQLWVPGQPLPNLFYEAIDCGIPFVAHNAGFEAVYWEAQISPLMRAQGFPLTQPAPGQWECTAIRAAANGLPRSLDECCKALGLPAGKDEEGRAALEKMWSPKRGQWVDTPELRQLVYRYNAQDLALMFDVFERTEPPSDYDRKVYVVHNTINARGIPIDIASADTIDTRLGDAKHPVEGTFHYDLQRRLWAATDNQVVSTTKTAKFKEWCEAFGVEMPNFRQETIESKLIHWQDEWPDKVRKALTLRRTQGLVAAKKFSTIRARAETSDEFPQGWAVLRDSYVMDGAHTGRWSARGVQTQNLMAETISPDGFQALLHDPIDDLLFYYGEPVRMAGTAVRPIIRALPNHLLFVGDFSKIELCVLFWLAAEHGGLGRIRDGEDIYKLMAATIFGVPVEEVTKDQRQLGKRAILGLGFGCGAARFQKMCEEQDGVLIPLSLAEKAVNAYRTLYRAVMRFWYDLEGSIRSALLRPGLVVEFKGLLIYSDVGTLAVRLPSGRILYYQNAEVGPDGEISYWGLDSKTQRWCKQHTWGGKLTENVVQAIANDLLREAMLRVEAAGYPVVMHSHDELVSHARTDQTLEAFKHIMELRADNDNTPLPWWHEIPITVEATALERYSK